LRLSRSIAQLQAIGIRGRLQTLERGVYNKRRQGGMKEWPGINILLAGARIGASWANWYESLFKCGGQLSRLRKKSVGGVPSPIRRPLRLRNPLI